MINTLLVAAREFRQILNTRGFWMTLLAVPLALTVSVAAGRFFGPQFNVAYVLVDASGQYAPAIERRIERDYQRQVLGDLSTYAARWKVGSADPGAVWARGPTWFTDAQIDAFVAQGGVAEAMRRIRPRLPDDAPVFKPPPRPYLSYPPPRGAPVDQGPERFGSALTPLMRGDVATTEGKRPLALAVYIPKDFGQPGAAARMWTNGRPNGPLVETIRSELSAALRLRVLEASGLPPDRAAGVEAISAPIQLTVPPSGGGRAQMTIRSALPLALVYLLLVTAVTTGSMMLQGVIEERSNRLLESVLACIRPGELMYGKLLGLGAVGLTIVAVWIGFAAGAAYATPGFMADLMRPALSALDQPWMIGALIFYFLSGYLIVSTAFLTIGSLSDSLQDAQGYLTPVMMGIMLPVILMMQATLRSPDAILTKVMSWIPVYTPFAMLARLGNGVPLPEMLGTGALLVAFLALELFLLGRVFRASLLSSGQPPKLGAFARLMFQPQKD